MPDDISSPSVLMTIHGDDFTLDAVYDYFHDEFVNDLDKSASVVCFDQLVAALKLDDESSSSQYASDVADTYRRIEEVRKYNDALDYVKKSHPSGIPDKCPVGFDLSFMGPSDCFDELHPSLVPPIPLPPPIRVPYVEFERRVSLMDIDSVRYYLDWLPSSVDYVCVGAEYGGLKHRLHYHVVLTFDTAVSDHLAVLADVVAAGSLGVRPHVRPVEDFHLAVRYACKANNFRCSDFVLPGCVDPSVVTLRRWQKDLFELPNVDRQVICIVDMTGKHGKTFFTRYLESLYQGVYCKQFVSADKITQNVHNLCVDYMHWVDSSKGADYMANKTIVFDIPRSKDDSGQLALWQAVEEVKGGHLTDTRYNTRFVVCSSPKVILFLNWIPDFTGLSLDRWLVFNISNMESDDCVSPLASYWYDHTSFRLDDADVVSDIETSLDYLDHIDFVFTYQPGCSNDLMNELVSKLGIDSAVGVRVNKYNPSSKSPCIRFWRVPDVSSILFDVSNMPIGEVGFALRDYLSQGMRRKLSTYEFVGGKLTNYRNMVR